MATVLLPDNGQIVYRSLKLTVDTEDTVYAIVETYENRRTLKDIEQLQPIERISDLCTSVVHINDIFYGMRVLRAC